MTTDRVVLLVAELAFVALVLARLAFREQDPRRKRTLAYGWAVLGAGCLVSAGGLLAKGDGVGWLMLAAGALDLALGAAELFAAERESRASRLRSGDTERHL